LRYKVPKYPQRGKVNDSRLEPFVINSHAFKLYFSRFAHIDGRPHPPDGLIAASAFEILNQRLQGLVISQAELRPKAPRFKTCLTCPGMADLRRTGAAHACSTGVRPRRSPSGPVSPPDKR